ncbi:hypothetical protein BH23VER1_BH23VER1_03650 [soil metagenome]
MAEQLTPEEESAVKAPDEPTNFFVAKDEQEHGPYDETEILTMLQTGEVTKRDMVYYDGLGEWKPIDEVFEIQEALTHFMDEGQEPEVVVKAYNIISEMLGGDEEIYYIAHQRKKFLRGNRDVVVVTNHRLVIVKHHLTGHEIEDYLWSNIVSVQTKEGIMGSVFAIRHSNDHVFEVDAIPHAQLARLVQLSQELRG